MMEKILSLNFIYLINVYYTLTFNCLYLFQSLRGCLFCGYPKFSRNGNLDCRVCFAILQDVMTSGDFWAS